jgi:hypothetical protein
MASGFDLTELVASLGNYHRTFSDQLYSKLINRDYSQKYFRTVAGVKDEYVADEFMISEITQPYQKAWTPKGIVSFAPAIIKARPIKVDIEFEPKDLEQTWEGKRIDGSLPEGQDFLESYIFDQIIAKIKREIEYKIAYTGVYKAPTPGTPGAAQDSADGLLTVVDAGITAGTIEGIDTGAIDETNAIDSLEAVYDAVDDEYKDGELIALVDGTVARAYKRDYRSAYGPNQDYTAMGKEGSEFYIDGTNCKVVTAAGLNGTGRVIITLPDNLIRVIDGTQEDSNFNVRFQVDKRIIDTLADFKMGWGFGITDGLVWANKEVPTTPLTDVRGRRTRTVKKRVTKAEEKPKTEAVVE